MLSVQNGSSGTIESIDLSGNILVKLDNNTSLPFNINQYRYLDYAYAISGYKSQGMTGGEVIIYNDTKALDARGLNKNYNSFYVSISRGKQDYQIFTDNISRMIEQAKEEIIKSSTIDVPIKDNKANNSFPKDQFEKLSSLDLSDKHTGSNQKLEQSFQHDKSFQYEVVYK